MINYLNEKTKKKIEQESSNGFNSDYKSYINLNILRNFFAFPAFILLFIIICLTPIYIFTQRMIKNTNHLLIVQNYIFSSIIISTTSTIDIKCFISECQDIKEINSNALFNYDIIQDIIKGLNLFTNVNHFYNDKYLINACEAAINKEEKLEEYNKCLDDFIIKTANNTENLLKIMDDLIHNIKKEFEINCLNNDSYCRKNLFNDINYKQIEKIFFEYVMPVEGNFVNYILDDLNLFLFISQIYVIIILSLFTVIEIIICILSRIILIKKLVHNLSVSRCIIKIIPTSIIISTPELENWIENKY